jgi:hypothetical protein
VVEVVFHMLEHKGQEDLVVEVTVEKVQILRLQLMLLHKMEQLNTGGGGGGRAIASAPGGGGAGGSGIVVIRYKFQ